MSSSVIEAFELLSFTEVLAERVRTAAETASPKQGFKNEKTWLQQAVDLISTSTEGVKALVKSAVKLPELAQLREEHAQEFQNAVIDAVEKLQGGITFQHGSRSPLLEALFGTLKLPQLRRADRESFQTFCTEFEKRLNSGYSKRMLADPGFAFALPVVSQWQQSVAQWQQAFTPEPLEETEATALRDQLVRAAEDLEVPLRQVRLLCEAALAPLKNGFEESGIGQKPKRKIKAVPTSPVSASAPAEEKTEVVTEVTAAEPAAPAAEQPKKARKKAAPVASQAS